MKRILWAVMALIITGCALMPVNEGGQPYRRAIYVPNRSRDQIFDQSRVWLNRQFSVTRPAIEYESRERGLLVAAGTIPRPLGVVNPLGGGSIDFSLRAEITGSEVRITCDRFTVVEAPEYNHLTGANAREESYLRYRGDMEYARQRLNELTADLGRFLKDGPAE